MTCLTTLIDLKALLLSENQPTFSREGPTVRIPFAPPASPFQHGLLQLRGDTDQRAVAHTDHDPAAGQSGLAGPDRIPAEAPGRVTAACGAPLLRQLQLSGAELEQAAPRRGQGRVASG